MDSMDESHLAADVHAACRLSGRFQLRSGEISSEYFDKYLFESDPALLKRVAQAMVPLIPPGTDLLGGLELGGVPIATVVSQLTGIPTIFVRKEAKKYGTCRLAEGAEVGGRTVTLIEDVISTGGAVRNAALALRRDNARVSTVICAIDRRPEAGSVLDAISVAVLAVMTKSDLDGIHGASG
jgi:orotate phosphoribosyltransferase